MRKFTEFSSLLTTKNTRKWIGRNGSLPILGVTHDPRAKNVIIMYDDSAIYVINKAKVQILTNVKLVFLKEINFKLNK